jgi:hypothetical protein
MGTRTYLLPELLEESLALLLSIIERVLLSKVVAEPGKGRHPVLVQLGTCLLVLVLLFLGELALSHRQTEVRRALENGDRLGIFGGFLCELDTRRTCAYHGHSLALGRYAFCRPEGRVVHLALEGVQALPVGKVAFGREANGVDEVFGVGGSAILSLDVPSVCLEVELGAYDPRVEGCVFLDLQLLFDVFEVSPEFVVVRIFLCPCPVLVDYC